MGHMNFTGMKIEDKKYPICVLEIIKHIKCMYWMQKYSSTQDLRLMFNTYKIC